MRLSMLFYIFLMSCFVTVGGCKDSQSTQEFNVPKPSPERYVIFSPMDGVLMRDGQPLANAKIVRKLTWNGNSEGHVQSFCTDEQGRFSLPLHEEELSLNMLTQFVAKADISVELEGNSVEIWYGSKTSQDLYSETDGPVDGLICDINNEEVAVPMRPVAILTRCRWNGMPK